MFQTKVEQIKEYRGLAAQWRGFVDHRGNKYDCHADKWDRIADAHQAQLDKDNAK